MPEQAYFSKLTLHAEISHGIRHVETLTKSERL